MIKKLKDKKYFLEVYVGIIASIVLLGWLFNSIVSMAILLLIFVFSIFYFKDLKYGIPIILFFIFTISEGFSNEKIPIPYIIIISIVIGILVIFNLRIKIKDLKSVIGFLGLAVCNFIPIFWAHLDNYIFYSFYFIGFGYLFLYIMLTNGIKSNCIDILVVSMSYLGIILSFECIYKVITLKDTVNNVFNLWYYLGWGLCNEAGILMCMSIPFNFYLLGKTKKDWFFQVIKMLIVCIGFIMTMSRGTYIFGILEIMILAICLLFYAENKKLYKKIFTGLVCVGTLILIMIIPLLDDIIANVFKHGLGSNGRIEIWKNGLSVFSDSFVFGPGICSVIKRLNTAIGFQDVPLVFHSSIVEVLVVGGVVGLIFFIIHLVEKYRALLKMDKLFFITSLVGYIIVDLYGLIDNTYYMYYYMIVLVVIMAVIDKNLINKDIS